MIEYRVTCLAFTPQEATGQMNAMAADGWRFVATIGPRGGMGVIMAREGQRTNWEVMQEARAREILQEIQSSIMP